MGPGVLHSVNFVRVRSNALSVGKVFEAIEMAFRGVELKSGYQKNSKHSSEALEVALKCRGESDYVIDTTKTY